MGDSVEEGDREEALRREPLGRDGKPLGGKNDENGVSVPMYLAPAAPLPTTRYTAPVRESTVWQVASGGEAWLMMFRSAWL